MESDSDHILYYILYLNSCVSLRRRRCTLSKTHRIEKGEEEVQVKMADTKLNFTYTYLKMLTFLLLSLPHQYDSVHNNTAPSDFTQKADADNQDIHYSSISFKSKHASSIPTDEYPTDTTETESVHYATVRFK